MKMIRIIIMSFMVLRTCNSSTVILEMEAEDCNPEANSGCIVSWKPALALQ